MSVTIKDISAYTGLGVATISSYLNGGNVRPKNKILIETAIKTLDYEINETARGLKTNKTKTVGILIPELNILFFSEIVTIIEERMQAAGYATILCSCHNNSEQEAEKALFLLKKRVDGLFSIPVNENAGHLQPLLAKNKPCVLLDRYLMTAGCDAVVVDNISAARSAVEHFLQNGHLRIGLIGGPQEVYTARERLAGYQQALDAAGLPFAESLVVQTDYTIKSGAEKITELVQRNPDMTAVFIVNYETTVGALIGLNELGLRVPEDISLIGYDNLDFARAVHPQLTIVTQPVEMMAKQACEIMLSRLAGEQSNPRCLKLKAGIAAGRSVRTITTSSI